MAVVNDMYGALKICWESVLVCHTSVHTTTDWVNDKAIRGVRTHSSSSRLRVPHLVLTDLKRSMVRDRAGSDVSHFHDDPFTY